MAAEAAAEASPGMECDADVLQALHRKRKALDKEVADFRALKEEEFTRYERRLSEGRERSRSLECSHGNGLCLADTGPGAVATLGREERLVRDGSDAHLRRTTEAKSSSPLTTTAGDSRVTHADSSFQLQPQPRHLPNDGHPSSDLEDPSPKRSVHNRDLELDGLFMPSYLPLLESPQRHHRQHRPVAAAEPEQSAKFVSSPSSPPSRLSNPQHTETPSQPIHLETAPALPSTTYSPDSEPSPKTSPMPVPSSPERERSRRPSLARGHRNSSSQSETSGSSLRSSLRKSTVPRSPKQKHVRISIDNVITSPSASPILTRTAHSLLKSPGIRRRGSDPPGMDSHEDMVDDMDEDGIDFFGAPLTRTPPSGGSLMSPMPISGSTRTLGTSGSGRSYHDMIEPTTPTSLDGHDDFEDILGAEDPIFSYNSRDDDGDPLEYDDPGDPVFTDDEKGEDDQDRSDSMAIEKDIPTASPHAWSLPIEIKWPGRRTSAEGATGSVPR